MIWKVFHLGCFLLLNSDPRAVEFFIRDKYEKKKYYSEKVTNGSSVCIYLFVIKLSEFYTVDCFWWLFVPFCQPRDAKKEREADRGSRASSYSKVSNSQELPGNKSLPNDGLSSCVIFRLQSFWRVKSPGQFQKRARLNLPNPLSTC